MNVIIREIPSVKASDPKKPLVVVLGAGESGTGAALLAKKLGFSIFVSDMGEIKDDYKRCLLENEIPFEEAKHTNNYIIESAGLVIKSPGISDKSELINKLKEKEIEVIDEIEFASRFTNAKIIAITGSNGKTTVTRLIYHILKTAGMDVGLAGNVGYSLARQVAEGDRALYALEISSFQLDGCKTFKPNVAILTNITPDHLDRYDYEFDNYIASKFKIIQNKDNHDVLIYNSDDENIKKGFDLFTSEKQKSGNVGISMKKLSGENELLQVEHTDFAIKRSELTLQGWHNRFNISCAVKAVKLLGIPNVIISDALKSFKNEDHRLESLGEINEVEYINDSKATNVDSVFYALEAMKKPIIWIVGGVDKGNDYSPLFNLVKEKVKAIVCVGKDNSKLLDTFKNFEKILVETASMQEAVKMASLYAEKGEVVLLSPACASFDLFNNYQHRGNVFKEIVKGY